MTTTGGKQGARARARAPWVWALVAAALAAGAACGGSSVGTGGLSVTVKDSTMASVEGAVVTTDPATSSQATDAHGQVVFSKIKAGFYAVTAIHPTLGAARAAVTVTAGGLAKLTLTVRPSSTPSAPGAPTAQILSPASGTTVAPGTSVTLRGLVGDDKDAPDALAIKWTSSIDGTLSTDHAMTDGTVVATAPHLSVGAHLLSLEATDSDGLQTTASITLTVAAGGAPDGGAGTGGAGAGRDGGGGVGGNCAIAAMFGFQGGCAGANGSGGVDGAAGADGGAGHDGAAGADGGGAVDANGQTIVLATPTKDTNGVGLSWTSSATFATYNIHRRTSTAGAFTVIDILNSPATLTYRDEGIMLGVSYDYQVGGVAAGGAEVLSNIVTVTTGVFIDVASAVERMKVDPTRKVLYAVDKVNNSLHFVDLTTNTVSSTIFVGSSPVDLDFSADDSELYIANYGSTEIAVVDLAMQKKSRSLLVDTSLGTWQGNPYRLAVTTASTLVFTSYDQWNNLKLVRTSDGGNITTTGSVYEPGLAASPDRTHLYVGESGSSGSTLIRYDVTATTLTQADQSVSIGYGSRGVVVSGDGKYLFYATQKYLATNLKSVLGTFSEVILAANGDGSKVVGSTKIFDGTTFAVIKPLPLTTQVLALSPDGKTVYLYDSTKSRIYLYGL